MAAQLSAVRAKVWLLHLKSSSRAMTSLSVNVIREVCCYIEDSLLLYQVTSHFLK